MKKLMIGSLLTLASLSAFAQNSSKGDLSGVKCNERALKTQNEDVKLAIHEMMIETKVEVLRKLGSLLVQVDPDQIIVIKKERGFANNFDSKVSGTAALQDGTIINIEGVIQYSAAKESRYDRIGNKIEPVCAFQAFSNVILVNGETGRVIDSLNVRPVKINLNFNH